MSCRGKLLFAVLALASAVSCATAPDKVPEIDSAQLPPLKLEGLKPHALKLDVHNERSINQKAGNSAAVEAALAAALSDSAKRGGIELSPSAKNHLKVAITDCPDQEEGTACIRLKGALSTGRSSMEMTASGSQGYSRNQKAGSAFGDVSQAYELAAKLLVQGLNEHFSKAP